MILVDTSVRIDCLRHGDARLAALLAQLDVLVHSLVIGELALGHWRHRDEAVDSLEKPPRLAVVGDDDVMRLIGRHGLQGTGIAYVDAHLLASLRAVPGCRLWTRDRRCRRRARDRAWPLSGAA